MRHLSEEYEDKLILENFYIKSSLPKPTLLYSRIGSSLPRPRGSAAYVVVYSKGETTIDYGRIRVRQSQGGIKVRKRLPYTSLL